MNKYIYYEGMTTYQLAKIMGISTSTLEIWKEEELAKFFDRAEQNGLMLSCKIKVIRKEVKILWNLKIPVEVKDLCKRKN